jgi:uncharacterized SAM-binding protein YcdF (DUF218 family)
LRFFAAGFRLAVAFFFLAFAFIFIAALAISLALSLFNSSNQLELENLEQFAVICL